MRRLRVIDPDDLETAVGGTLCQQLAPTAWGNLIQGENSGRYTGWHGKGNKMWGAYGMSQWSFTHLGSGVGRLDQATPHAQDVAACKIYCRNRTAGHWPENGYLIRGTPCPDVIE